MQKITKSKTTLEVDLIIQALDHLDQGLSVFDGELNLILFNKKFQTLLDYPDDFLETGMSFADLLRYNIDHGEYGPGDKEQQFQERMDQVKHIRPHQFVRSRPDGTVISVKGTPLPDGGFITQYSDVTHTPSDQTTLVDIEEQFRTYLELSPVGAMLVELDGTVRFINARMLDIFGYDRSDEGSISTLDFYANLNDRITFLDVLQNNDTPSSFRFMGKKKNGETFPTLITSKIINLKGKDRIFSWVNDLTTISKAEETIQKLSERNELILSAAGAGILEIDDANKIQFINPAAAKLLGYEPEELKDQPLANLLMPDSDIADLLHSDRNSGETQMHTKSKAAFPVKFNVSRISNSEGHERKIIVFDDISERVATEDVLRQAMKDIENSSRAKSNFLSVMSHELRTPLNAILGFAQILNKNPENNLNDQQLKFIEHMFSAGEHLLKLINEAIDISAIENGQVSLSKQALNMCDIIDVCVQQVQVMADKKNVNIIKSPHAGHAPIIIADQARFQQIVVHLLSNAIKYNKPEGTVTLSCEEPTESTIRLIVSDTGRGIAETEHNDIFAPFNRLTAHSEGIEGTGLGLTLCKHLCDLMGGKIGFFTKVNEGSSFWIEFPKAENDSPLIPMDDH
ncbi:PAS-domain containing protein [Terasakiella sp. A23]|uniref:PAS-domain containing protein n=1 Tax=Terasakiella sp. FCG-A23 TaxID=3080561 RepID=UPI00295462D1|nr:PAS-domain containing protein [Terasakiella sp. A23]MDV7340545.1 PAS-domain containing protein [Terasakiella sp. A23]